MNDQKKKPRERTQLIGKRNGREDKPLLRKKYTSQKLTRYTAGRGMDTKLTATIVYIWFCRNRRKWDFNSLFNKATSLPVFHH